MTTVLITGANKGIGLELVKQFAARGDKVLACCRNPKAADELQQVADNVSIHQLDVADPASISTLVKSLDGREINLLINNAGVMGPPSPEQSVLNMDFDGWMETLNVNTLAPVRMLQSLIENLRAAGNAKVMTVTSQMGALSFDMTVAYAYCTSKAAVNKFMKMAAIELKKENLMVGLVHPGWVRTDMGGKQADLSPLESATGIVSVVDGMTLDNTGGFWKWNGETHDW